jgi:hypothetical protein
MPAALPNPRAGAELQGAAEAVADALQDAGAARPKPSTVLGLLGVLVAVLPPGSLEIDGVPIGPADGHAAVGRSIFEIGEEVLKERRRRP